MPTVLMEEVLHLFFSFQFSCEQSYTKSRSIFTIICLYHNYRPIGIKYVGYIIKQQKQTANDFKVKYMKNLKKIFLIITLHVSLSIN